MNAFFNSIDEDGRAGDKAKPYLEYQPQYDLHNRKIAAIEVLLRWNDPYLGVLGPSEFIPIIEEANEIDDLNRWLLNEIKKIKDRYELLKYIIFSIYIGVCTQHR